MLGGEQAFAEVAADDLLRLADGCEVCAGVPFEEQIEIERRVEGGGSAEWRIDLSDKAGGGLRS